jgi:pyrimidine-nucleoside phosphorylase
MSKLHIPSLIAKKRDGSELSEGEIRELIARYTDGDVSDAQMSAWAMAVYFSGMNVAETAALTMAMLESGEQFSFQGEHPLIVDKHSTGGIGDKISLILAPLVACCDCWIPMVSGRGLGITGGTLDKLESIPGFRVGLSIEEAKRQLGDIGVVIMGQTERFCPADRKLYALRDVTATVPSMPLITASIMSKKLAENLDRLVLDVKYGRGAFMKTREEGVALAKAMEDVGSAMGVRVKTQLNAMDEPLGYAVGNALEVIEAVQLMRGQGPADVRELVISQTAMIVDLSREEIERRLDSGLVWEKFCQMVAAQGGRVEEVEKLAEIHRAPVIRKVKASSAGMVIKLDAGGIGQTALELGAGRSRADEGVDHRVGFDQLVKVGHRVEKGDTLARIHAVEESAAMRAEQSFFRAVEIA